MERSDDILEVRNLKINFHTYAGTVQAIRGVNFDLKKGETLAIVGESGSGKTAATRSIIGLNAPNEEIVSGSIKYKNHELLHRSEKYLSNIRDKEIAEIFQAPMTSLDPTMKIGKQVAEPLLLHERISKQDAMKKALQMLKAVGITNTKTRMNDYPYQFSGGMRQRIVIAIALIDHPQIVIADEPTTSLDVTIQAKIIDLMKKLQKKLGMSIIFITHDLGVVAGIANRVAVMYAGRIVEYGTTDEIYYNPKNPYTWGLICSMPTMNTNSKTLPSIPGTPPDLLNPPKGDAFAPRNKYALKIDTVKQPPFFKVSPTHYAATWLLDSRAPKITPPKEIIKRHREFEKLKSESRE